MEPIDDPAAHQQQQQQAPQQHTKLGSPAPPMVLSGSVRPKRMYAERERWPCSRSRFFLATPHPLARASAGIQFGLLTSADVLRMSVGELNHPDLYVRGTKTPTAHGVLDYRLGTSVKTHDCNTCGHGVSNCSGHFGHITLALPIFHAGYHKSMIGILNQICKVVWHWGFGVLCTHATNAIAMLAAVADARRIPRLSHQDAACAGGPGERKRETETESTHWESGSFVAAICSSSSPTAAKRPRLARTATRRTAR